MLLPFATASGRHRVSGHGQGVRLLTYILYGDHHTVWPRARQCQGTAAELTERRRGLSWLL